MEYTALSYAQARSSIQTGDCIGVVGKTLIASVIRAAQRIGGLRTAHVTHTAVAQWVGDRLFAVEMGSSGNVYRPLSQYAGHTLLVSGPPAGCDMAGFDAAIAQATDAYTPYGFVDLLVIGLRLLPRRLVDTSGWGGDGGRDQVCSYFARHLYELLGGDVSAMPHLPCPAEVTGALPLRMTVAA